jgi:hypothetical protein
MTKAVDDCDESVFVLVVSVDRATNGDRSMSSAAPATLSDVCFALTPVIADLKFEPRQRLELADLGR